MKILCLGDSLTFGSVGHTYLSYLGSQISAVNKGKNGDTTRGAARRLKRYLRSPRYSDISTYVVSVGTNDLLGPYLATLSPFWKLIMKPRGIYKRCIYKDATFASEYEKMLFALERSNKKTVLVGLPYSEIEGIPLDRFRARSAIIQELAAKHGIPFIDLYSLQLSAVEQPGTPYSWGFIGVVRVLDAATMLVAPRSKAWFPKLRDLRLTVDGIHFNALSARMLGEEVSKVLLEEDESRTRQPLVQ